MNTNSELIFSVNKKKGIGKLLLDNKVVAIAYFSTENPDELINQKYIGLFKLETNKEHRGKGYMKTLLNNLFNYFRNNTDIIYVLLNVYKSNTAAVKLYLNNGFEVYKDFDDVEDEEPYFTLIKKL